MSEFTIRSESVDVEQIMKQIRQRILEKRGADYTEDQIRELASVRLEKFLDPNNLRSDLLEQFRKSRPAVVTEPPPITPPYTPEEADIFATHRGALRVMRKLFNPLLKMMFNPNPLLHVIHKQADFNTMLLKREARRKIEFDRSRAEWNSLYYEVLHNLVLETTRMGIEVQNLRMKVESLSSRLDFSERRVRALEGVVQYRPEVMRASERHDAPDDDHAPAQQASTGSLEGFVPAGAAPGPGDGSGRKRRRRRRGRRGGQSAEGASGASGALGALGALGASGDQGASNARGAHGGQGTDIEQGFDNGDDEDEETDDGDGFEIPEPLERADTLDSSPEPPEAPEAPQAPQAPQAPKPDSEDDPQ